MIKSQLSKSVAKKSGLTVKQAAAAIDATIYTIRQTIKSGENVLLVGFGTFSAPVVAPHRVINPKTLQAMTLPARRTAKFKASKALQAYIR